MVMERPSSEEVLSDWESGISGPNSTAAEATAERRSPVGCGELTAVGEDERIHQIIREKLLAGGSRRLGRMSMTKKAKVQAFEIFSSDSIPPPGRRELVGRLDLGSRHHHGLIPFTALLSPLAKCLPLCTMRLMFADKYRDHRVGSYQTYGFYKGPTVFDFGHGLSYTNFTHTIVFGPPVTIHLCPKENHSCNAFECDPIAVHDSSFYLHVKIKNAGERVASLLVHSATLRTCLAKKFKNDSGFSKEYFTQENSSNVPILEELAHNRRFLNAGFPKSWAIITPKDEYEVQAIILCAKRHGIQIRIRSRGHDYEGLPYTERRVKSGNDFLLLDLKLMRKVSVDVKEKSVWVEYGATIGELYFAIAKSIRTLGFPAGVSPMLELASY
ncbi:unnamed protein product [Cuscuta campestris]|uniref:FAD-binding PCMH-type domain-containing protein n=1 Tax=Cuscuta campestris TaxID=132261 RepID=A0A484MUD2_9ASTE|nr:unnamed protein product [Cuscuta campestris]